MLKKRVCYILFSLSIIIAIVYILICEQSNKGGTTMESINKLTKEEVERIHALTFEAAVELNENSDIDNTLLKKIDDIHDYAIKDNQQGDSDLPALKAIAVREGVIDGYIGSYPYDTVSYYFTGLNMRSKECHVLGIKVGDKINLVKQAFEKYEYIELDISDNEQAYTDSEGLFMKKYKKYDVIINIYAKKSNSIIEEITISIQDVSLPPEDPNAVY